MSFLSRRLTPLAAGLLVTACAGNGHLDQNQRDLAFCLEGFENLPQRQEILRRLNGIVANTQQAPEDNALQRYYAAFLLTQVHMGASLQDPFLTEQATTRERIGGIGRPDPQDLVEDRPSTDAHLVATIYHASYARSIYYRAVRSGPALDGVTLLPEELWTLGVDEAEINLQILMTVAYSRLGFREEVAKALDKSPDLQEPRRSLAFLERVMIQPKVKPWVCEMLHVYMRDVDELAAYRFGVLAIEGRERFGEGLPSDVVDHIEEWITDGASVMFVCPESQTAFIAGQRRSPISGVPHLEYIPIEREGTEPLDDF